MAESECMLHVGEGDKKERLDLPCNFAVLALYCVDSDGRVKVPPTQTRRSTSWVILKNLWH